MLKKMCPTRRPDLPVGHGPAVEKLCYKGTEIMNLKENKEMDFTLGGLTCLQT